MGNVGGKINAISVSGNESAVSVTAAYIAPEAPSDGRSLCAELLAPSEAAALKAAATDVVLPAFMEADISERSCDTRRGNWMRALKTCETRPEKSPPKVDTA